LSEKAASMIFVSQNAACEGKKMGCGTFHGTYFSVNHEKLLLLPIF